jgi:hypothetical protein
MSKRRKKGSLSDLWETLIRPDHDDEEMKERLVVIEAANQLQVGEFQLLQLAYREWHGEDLPEALVSKIFTDYMLKSEVPHWARHYARNIVTGCEDGNIDMNALGYHRYGHDYGAPVRHPIRRFCFAVASLVLFIGGGILIANIAAVNPASMFPPYLDVEDLPKQK